MHKTIAKIWLLLLVSWTGGCTQAQNLTTAGGQGTVETVRPATSRLGINLGGIHDWMSELPFVNVFRSSRTWVSQKQGEKWGSGPVLDLDEHGWVKRLEAGTFAETPFLNVPSHHYPHGNYTFLYDGEGRVEVQGAGKIVESKPGRIVFELGPSDKFKTVRIMSTNPANYIRNIRILMPGTEATHQENPWNPVFVERWKNFNTIRFMDWMKTNNSHVKEWADRPKMDDATWTAKGVPLEMMIALSNQLNINPWFCMPHLASDDYVRRFAAQVKRDLKPGLKPYIEYSNEIWNSMFDQTKYSDEQGIALGFDDNAREAGFRFSAHRSVQIFKIWEEVYGGHEPFVRVIATQAANTNVTQHKLTFQDAYKSCDALATAPYFSWNIAPRNPNRPDDKLVAEEVVDWTPDQILDEVEKNRVPQSIEWMKKQKAFADQYKLEHIAYEGGQHVVGLRDAMRNEKLTKLLQQVNRSERMGELYKRYLDAWRDQGNGLFAIFSSVSPWRFSGSWGLLEFNDDTTPKYDAVMEWNQNNRLPTAPK